MAEDRRINWLIAVALVGWLIYLLAPVLTPFVAAALLAYICDPLADRLERAKFPRTLAVVSVFLLMILVLALLILLVGPLIQSQISALFSALPDIIVSVEQVWLPKIMSLLNVEAGDDVGVGSFLARYSDTAGTWAASILMSVSKSGGAVATAFLSLFLIPILTFYLLRDWDKILSQRAYSFQAAYDGVATSSRDRRRSRRIFSRSAARHVCPDSNLFHRIEFGRAKVCDRDRCCIGPG